MNTPDHASPDSDKGAVESHRPEDNADGNVASFAGQLNHRFQDPLNKSSDSGMSEVGQTPEFSMEKQGTNELKQDTYELKQEAYVRPREEDADAEANSQDQDPGQTQRQGHDKDDPLAA